MRLTIEKLVYGGDGLARLPADEQGRGKAVFLPFVLEDEAVDATLIEQKPGFARARAERIVEASSLRMEPACPYFQQCGGCHYQHTSYEHQLEIKTEILKENLRRIAKLELDCELVIVRSPPWNYRNRARFRVQTAPRFAVGYYRFGSHELLPVEQCPISSPLINRALAALWQWGGSQEAACLQELEFFGDAEDRQMLASAYVSQANEPSALELLGQQIQGLLPEVTGVAMFAGNRGGDRHDAAEARLLYSLGNTELMYSAGNSSYRVSAGAFFQVNRHLLERLLGEVVSEYSGDIALDLYAGVGLFSKALAKRFAQVIAVESSQTSSADLAYNLPVGAKAVRATSEEYLRKAARKQRPGVVVVDPPRSGLGEKVVRSLIDIGASKLVYVSCDPATLARDLKPLLAAGYRVERASLFDLFPQTFHLESVFHLAR